MSSVASCFSKQARQYDMHHQIHTQSMKDLLKLLQSQKLDLRSFLEAGCGTTELLYHIRSEFPGASFMGNDVSCEMIQIAKTKIPEANFLFCDAILDQRDVDCLLAHFSFQWMKPFGLYLEHFFKKASFVVLSVPLDESFSSWKKLHQIEGMSHSLFSLPSIQDFQFCKERIIKEVVIDYPLSFQRPIDFAYYLKNLGADFTDKVGPALLKKKWFLPEKFETNYRVYHVILQGDKVL